MFGLESSYMEKNTFRIVGVRTDGDKAVFVIRFLEDEAENRTKKYYLENCFRGVYISFDSQKYELFTICTGASLEAEILSDVIFRVSNAKRTMGIFVRLQVGKRVWDQPVLFDCETVQTISFGHLSTYYCIPKNSFQFYFSNMPSEKWNYLKCFKGKGFHCLSIRANENSVELDLKANPELLQIMKECPDRYSFVLAWKDEKRHCVHGIHEVYRQGEKFTYVVPVEEIKRIGSLELNRYVFEWCMIDFEGVEYKISWSPNPSWKRVCLPVKDFWGEIFRGKDGALSVRVTTSAFFFDYLGTTSDGSGFLLRCHQNPVSFDIQHLLACHLTKEDVYEFSLHVVEETDKGNIYRVSFQCEDEQIPFREGAYQFFVDVREGFFEKRYPVKIRTEVQLTMSIRTTVLLPYFVHQYQYYAMLPYLDNNNHFKCLLDKKIIRINVKETNLSEKGAEILLSVWKEPFFEQVKNVEFKREDGVYFPADWKILEENDNTVGLRIYASLDKFEEYGIDYPLFPVLSFHDGPGRLFVQDNDVCSFEKGRSTKGESSFVSLEGSVLARLWTGHVEESFAVGLSKDLQVFLLEELALEDGFLLLRAGFCGDGVKLQENMPMHFVLEDVIERKMYEGTMTFSNGHIEGKICMEEIPCSNYALWIIWEGGKSEILMRVLPPMMMDKVERKKIRPKKINDALSLDVEELLLYEDATCKAVFEDIAQKAMQRIDGLRPVWLIGERYGLSARDNGLAFFKYCMSRTDLVADVYFVAKKNNPDWDMLEPYMDNVVLYDSPEHIRLDAVTEFYIVSHGIRDVMPSLYHDQCYTVYRKPVIYLQHGIAAMKKFDISNRSYGESIRRFIVSSEYEAQLMERNRQFWSDELAVTGLARHDFLVRSFNGSGNYILIVPTYRDGLVFKTEKEFMQSDFYRYYHHILSDNQLLEVVRFHGLKIVLCLHVEFMQFQHAFYSLKNDVVEISNLQEKPISDRLMECKMLVTDYSSISFDVIYLNKPVIYFQFDRASYDSTRGSYVDLDKDLPGAVVHMPEDLVMELQNTIENDFQIKEPYLGRRKKYFDFEDGHNSERIYHAILECREELNGGC